MPRRSNLQGLLLSSTILAGGIGATAWPIAQAQAADLMPIKAPPAAAPVYAVDGLNAKFDAFGGSIANRPVEGVRGAITAPLPGPYGFQIDLGAGSLDSRAFGNIAGHLFWRDPSRALLGLYVSHTHWDQLGGVHVTQVAGEGELYFGRLTLEGIAGVEFGNSVASSISTTTTIPPQIGVPGLTTTSVFTQGFDVKTRFFDQVNLKYYVTDDWDAYVGHRYQGGLNALALGTEVAIPVTRGIMASGFLEARVGEQDFHGIWGGVRFYFGNDKPLIGRHRSQDPDSWDSLFSLLNSQTQNAFSNSTTLPALPPPADSCVNCLPP
jgi:hypothetical protein